MRHPHSYPSQANVGGSAFKVAALSEDFAARNHAKFGPIEGMVVMHPQTGTGGDGIEKKLRRFGVWNAGNCIERGERLDWQT